MGGGVEGVNSCTCTHIPLVVFSENTHSVNPEIAEASAVVELCFAPPLWSEMVLSLDNIISVQ